MAMFLLFKEGKVMLSLINLKLFDSWVLDMLILKDKMAIFNNVPATQTKQRYAQLCMVPNYHAKMTHLS